MAKVDPELADVLAGDARIELDVIVTSAGSLDDLLAALRDVQVVHVYRLICGAAIRAPAANLRRLADSAAVATMEPVRPVEHRRTQ